MRAARSRDDLRHHMATWRGWCAQWAATRVPCSYRSARALQLACRYSAFLCADILLCTSTAYRERLPIQGRWGMARRAWDLVRARTLGMVSCALICGSLVALLPALAMAGRPWYAGAVVHARSAGGHPQRSPDLAMLARQYSKQRVHPGTHGLASDPPHTTGETPSTQLALEVGRCAGAHVQSSIAATR